MAEGEFWSPSSFLNIYLFGIVSLSCSTWALHLCTQAYFLHGMWNLSCPTGIEPTYLARWVINYWTTRKVLLFLFLQGP